SAEKPSSCSGARTRSVRRRRSRRCTARRRPPLRSPCSCACFQYFPRALALDGRMSAHAAPAPSGPTFRIPRRPYPLLLPKLSDPRLHLAAVIISLQVIGQVGFHFELSISQILLAIGTAAVLEVAITMRQQHVIMWPASALLTGNGVAFVLRVP